MIPVHAGAGKNIRNAVGGILVLDDLKGILEETNRRLVELRASL